MKPDYEHKEEKKEHGNETPCDYENCDGMMTWCGVCNCWTHTCCVSYGTCMCS